MKVRETVRVLLFDREDRLLLIRAVDGSVGPDGGSMPRVIWFTVGGAIDPGESLHAAAERELREETGLREVELGPALWYGEHVLSLDDEPTLFVETFLVGRTKQTEIRDQALTEFERKTILELRWWSLEELESTKETIYPRLLCSRVREAAAAGADAPLETVDLSLP